MPDHFPQFESDDDLEAWFDEADLHEANLDPALEIEIGDGVAIVLDDPWAQIAATSATSGIIETRVPAPT